MTKIDPANAARFASLPTYSHPTYEEPDVPAPGRPLRLPHTPQVAPRAAPRATDVPAAVRWDSSWEQPHDGTAIITRRMANCLDRAGIPVFLPAAGGRMRSEVDPEVLREVETLYDRTPRIMAVQLVHLVPSETKLRSALYPSTSFEFDQAGAESRHPRMILFSVWEQIPSERWNTAPMAVYLRKFAAHIVPCEMNRELLLLAGVPKEKIHVIHHPFDAREAEALQTRQRHIGPLEDVKFYSIGKWEPRKDPMTVLRAFLRAHRREDKPTLARGVLTFFTSDWWQQAGYPRVDEALEAACQQTGVDLTWARARVSFVTKPLPSMVEAHASHDVFVTSSCGEAWGMPAFDAVVAGKPVLAPKWGGLAEYLPDAGALPFRLEEAHPAYHLPMGRAKGMWARVDEDALEERMAALMAMGPSAAVATGVPYSEENFRRQNPEAVGQQIRAVVEQLVGADYPWHGSEP